MTDVGPANPRSAHVLFVDDSEAARPAELQNWFDPFGIETRLRHPEATIRRDLEWADLVVVDYFLTNWPERDVSESIARSPFDGLAAAATMRSALLPGLNDRHAGSLPPKALAFALWSSNLKEATFDLPEVVLPHVFSRENNLEWAFRRDDVRAGQGLSQIASLASAVTHLPARWPSDRSGAEQMLFEMLAIGDFVADGPANYWMQDARAEVLRCRPPVHELSERSHGLALVRWLLHRILPYPCFLLDEMQLRVRLRIDSLGDVGGADSGLPEELRPYRYSGFLEHFDGPRWWRAGVEDWLFTVTDGESGNPSAVRDAVTSRGAVTSREWLRPVIVIDGTLARSVDFAEVEDTVRVQPDDWPVFADEAYALRTSAADDPGLAALVIPADRDLIAAI